MMALVVAAVLLVRWVPQYGWFAAVLIFLALTAALGIYSSQRIRYVRSREGLNSGAVQADAVAVLWTSGSVLVLGAVGICAVLFLPLRD